MPRYDVITFDCYGTLIDWETGIREAFVSAAREAGAPSRDMDPVPVYARVEPDVEAGPYRSYREVLTETARRVAASLGAALPPSRAGFLADSLASWRPFPDTNPALHRLAAAGCRLGILSNVDDDLLGSTLRRLEVPFEPIVTAAQVRSYKPGPAHFLEARRRIPTAARWLHAAQSHFHDVEPCAKLGIPVAWINRKGERGEEPGLAQFETRDLASFAGWIEEA